MADDIFGKDNAAEPNTENDTAEIQPTAPDAPSDNGTGTAGEKLSAALDDAAASSERVTEDWTVPAQEEAHEPQTPKKKGTTIAAAVLAVVIVGVMVLLVFRLTGKRGGGAAAPETTVTENELTKSSNTNEYTIDDYTVTDRDSTGTPAVSKPQADAQNPETHAEVINGTIVVSNIQHINGSDETTIVYNNVPVPGEATGVNKISDEASNRFIQIIANNYSVDAALLVAIYPENFDGTDSDDNFVLQFNGTKDGDGKVVRSPETLEVVYKIDSQRNVVVNKKVGVAGQLVFSMVTELIMPQHPDYFTGVD